MAKKIPRGRLDPIFTDEVIDGFVQALLKGWEEYQKEQAEKKKAEEKKVDNSSKMNH